MVKSDIEVAREAKMRPIADVGEKLGVPSNALLNYGPYKAKISADYINSVQGNKDGKLILVTAISPTPAGEGKTTTTVGLGDGLNRIGKKAMSCLREPSLGPCFGVKGGAAGGGYAQVVPMEDINLHFTGDFHAITSREQPARGPDRQSHLLGQQSRPRPPPHHLAPRPRHERPRPALDRQLARRRLERLPARGRLRHHRRFRGHGHPLPRHGPEGSREAPRRHRHRLHAREEAGPRPRHQGRGRDDRAPQGRPDAQHGADAGEQPRVHSRRPVRQHRARLQLGARHQDRAEARRLRRDRSRLRR